MSIQAVAAVLDSDVTETPAQRLVAIAIANRIGNHPTLGPDVAWPSIPTIAREAGVSKRTATEQVGRLIDLGLLTVVVPASHHDSRVVRFEFDAWIPRPKTRRGAKSAPQAEVQPAAPEVQPAAPEVQTTAPRDASISPKPSLEPSPEPSQPSPCSRNGCDRGEGHRGGHRDPWFEAIEIALQEDANDRTRSRFGRLARMVENEGHAPYGDDGTPCPEILRRAAIIIATWGAAKLTINSLAEHWGWAGSPHRALTDDDIERFRANGQRARRLQAARGDTKPHLTDGGTP